MPAAGRWLRSRTVGSPVPEQMLKVPAQASSTFVKTRGGQSGWVG